VEAELRALLGDVVYGADVPSIQAVAFALLEAQG
jgi:nicotinamide-nucleotide amidase